MSSVLNDDVVGRGFVVRQQCLEFCFLPPQTFKFVCNGKPATCLVCVVKTPAVFLSGHGHSAQLTYDAQHRVKFWCSSDGRCRLQFVDDTIRFDHSFIFSINRCKGSHYIPVHET